MFLRRGSALAMAMGMGLCAPEPGDGGTGGGGASTDPPKSLTEEDVGRMVNSAITNHFERKLPKMLSDAIGGLKLGDQIESAVAKLAPKAEDQKPGVKTEDDALKAQVADLAKQLEASQKMHADAEKRRVETEQARLQDIAKQKFRDGIAPKVRPEQLDDLVDLAVARGKLKVDDKGNPTLTVKKAAYTGAVPEDVDMPLGEALPLFLASKEITPYLPAPGGGQQDKGGKGPGRTSTVVTTSPSDNSETGKANAAIEEGNRRGIDVASVLG